jgi:hypothetical protein
VGTCRSLGTIILQGESSDGITVEVFTGILEDIGSINEITTSRLVIDGFRVLNVLGESTAAESQSMGDFMDEGVDPKAVTVVLDGVSKIIEIYGNKSYCGSLVF